LDGDPPKIPRMVPTRDWAPPSFPTHLSITARSSTTIGTGTGEPQQRLRVDASFHQFRSPFWEEHGAVFAGRSAFPMVERPRGSRQSTGHASDSREPETTRLGIGPRCRNLVVTLRMQDGLRAASRRCCGSFAKQVAGNVENGEAPRLLWNRLEIRLDEKPRPSLRRSGSRHGQPRRQSPPHGVAVPSSDNGVGHYRLALSYRQFA
jgi:hypothetical protein